MVSVRFLGCTGADDPMRFRVMPVLELVDRTGVSAILADGPDPDTQDDGRPERRMDRHDAGGVLDQAPSNRECKGERTYCRKNATLGMKMMYAPIKHVANHMGGGENAPS